MRKWTRRLAQAVQMLCIGANVSSGLVQFHFHHFFGGGFALAAALFCFSLMVSSRLIDQQLARDLATLNGRRGVTFEAAEKARANLRQVVKATGAKILSDGSVALDTVDSSTFFIYPNAIAKRKKENCALDQRTCYYVSGNVDLPAEEIMATAILYLKHNPKLFEKWARRDGPHAD